MPVAEFIPSFHALFSHILCPTILIRVYYGVINYIREVSSSAGMQIWKYPGFTIA